MSGGPCADSATSRLPGLLALESRLESVRESPFDVPGLLRFALYVAHRGYVPGPGRSVTLAV